MKNAGEANYQNPRFQVFIYFSLYIYIDVINIIPFPELLIQ